MKEIRFCFRIDAAAGMAQDREGNPDECFSQMILNGCKSLPEDTEAVHKRMAMLLAKQVSIDSALVIPISEAEYDAQTMEE